MKFTNLITVSVLTATFALTGCKDEAPTNQPAAQQAAPKSQAAADHKHDHDHDHEGGAHSGPKHDLGSQKVGDLTVSVRQAGEVKAGEDATFEITVAAATKPKAIRAWVGLESGEGSTKVKARETPTFYDADLEVPNPLPANSKFWTEIELASETKSASFDLKK